ncbi:MAG: hypothetical protein IH586_06470, partial [Anaerolineaceae bacterium]|nr:hypothetical protein [Anaerolineaceae bacterium]
SPVAASDEIEGAWNLLAYGAGGAPPDQMNADTALTPGLTPTPTPTPTVTPTPSPTPKS